MGCCGNEEVDTDEDIFEAAQKKRSCTDIICLFIFVAFIVGMIYMFGFAVATGNPYRVIYGYDVTGDVCGTKNNPISGVTESGKDMTTYPYLFIDITRTTQIIGGQALTEANQLLQNVILPNVTSGTDAIPFCLTGSSSVQPSTSQLQASTSEAVELLKQNLSQSGAYIVRTEPSGVGFMTVALDRGRLVVYSTGDTSPDMKISVSGGTLSRSPVFYRKKRQAVVPSTDLNVTKLLAESDPISKILTGGGSCRYCVKSCPESYSIFFWRCVPNFGVSTLNSLFSGSGAESTVDSIVKDLEASWREIIYMCLVAFGLSLVVILLLRFLAGIIVYVIMILIALACIIGPIVLWLIWYSKKSSYDALIAKSSNNSQNQTSSSNEATLITSNLVGSNLATSTSEKDVTNYLILAIVATIVAVILLLILLVMRKRIQLVVQLFFEAGKAVQNMPILLFQPVLTFLAVVIIIISWTFGLVWIESAGYPSKSPDTGFITYVKNQLLALMMLFHIFGLFWLLQFVIACQHMVLAGAVSMWYFTREKGMMNMTVVSSMWRLLRYHLGTVAFGSFIIALVQLIRMIMKYLQKKAKEHSGNNKMVMACFKCIDCCLWCFEKCLKFLNRNAYIEVAIYGVNFCSGAKKAFVTLGNNILRVAALNSVGTFVLLLAKLLVVISTVLIGIEIMHARSSAEQPVKNEWAPILIAAIFSYMTSHCFVSVYGMAVDTIFLCFCEDSDKNDGISKPYYMSKGLMEYVENSAKAMEALKHREAEPTNARIVQVAPKDDDDEKEDHDQMETKIE